MKPFNLPLKATVMTILLSLSLSFGASAQEDFLGEIRMFAGNFAPKYWAFCEGQLLSVADNMALFSIVGTTYGGDGRTTFALPDLRGRVPVGPGQGLSLSNVARGEKGGRESITLTSENLPPHKHTLSDATVKIPISTDKGNQSSGEGNYLSQSSDRGNIYNSIGTSDKHLAPIPLNGTETSATGSGQAIATRQPYIGIHYIICVSGAYPPRN